MQCKHCIIRQVNDEQIGNTPNRAYRLVMRNLMLVGAIKCSVSLIFFIAPLFESRVTTVIEDHETLGENCINIALWFESYSLFVSQYGLRINLR